LYNGRSKTIFLLAEFATTSLQPNPNADPKTDAAAKPAGRRRVKGLGHYLLIKKTVLLLKKRGDHSTSKEKTAPNIFESTDKATNSSSISVSAINKSGKVQNSWLTLGD
jgi:hypothetical protein